MIIYYLLLLVGVVMVLMAIYNVFSIRKIEKNMDNYLFLVTSPKAYYVGAVLFSLAMLAIVAFQSAAYVFDIRVFSIVFFFASLFFLALSQLVYYSVTEKKLSDYKEFFKQFEINLDNKCEKLMLKHIYSKEKDLEKVKKIFKMNKELCKDYKTKKKKN
jgi:hypothetical protein